VCTVNRVSRGTPATTVEQIAARSGVSKPTVFASVGSKRDVIKRLREEAMAGDEEPVRPGAGVLLEADEGLPAQVDVTRSRR
jgi:AcrR family transcriptional regulator